MIRNDREILKREEELPDVVVGSGEEHVGREVRHLVAVSSGVDRRLRQRVVAVRLLQLRVVVLERVCRGVRRVP